MTLFWKTLSFDPVYCPYAVEDQVVSEWWEVQLTVYANTNTLDVGTHYSWVRAETEDCHNCTRVILNVLPGSQGIDEVTDRPPPPEDTPNRSWGKIKSLYR